MMTIRQVLYKNKVEFLDYKLSWATATIDNYIDVIREKADEKYLIYGIELQNPHKIKCPINYRSIDHHNEDENKPASIIQVYSVLKEFGIVPKEYKLSREEELIAANDAEYIPGLNKVNATEEEIRKIRKLDRKCQGVTPQEERDAKRSISEKCVKNGLTCVKTDLRNFTPIFDLLYPCDHVLVYSDSTLVYYGRERESFYTDTTETFIDVDFFRGGGEYGYFGTFNNNQPTIDKIATFLIEDKQIFSKHIYLYPFIWSSSKKAPYYTNNEFRRIKRNQSEHWERKTLSTHLNKPDNTSISEVLYNEKNYFFPFTHDTLFDSGNTSHVRHFERKMPHKPVYFIITPRDTENHIEYKLHVDKMHLNIYSSGVGVLSIFCDNYDYVTDNDILKINQFGRRLFPPFYSDLVKHDAIAQKLEIQGLSRPYLQVFDEDNWQMSPNTPAKFINQLISEVSNKIKTIKPILDDRMFVMSWYRRSNNPFINDNDYKNLYQNPDNPFLNKYFFIDYHDNISQSEDMYKAVMKNAIYEKWQRKGTLYGMTRYSFVMLTSSSSIIKKTKIYNYFETEYERLTELVLVQRASILRFSLLLNDLVTYSKYKNLSLYYADYIDYLSVYNFAEISAQDQASDIYSILSTKIGLKENLEHLDKQINEIQEYLELKNQRTLNILASLAVPLSIGSALYTFFYHDSFVFEHYKDYGSGLYYCLYQIRDAGPWFALICVIITIVVFFLMRFNKR